MLCIFCSNIDLDQLSSAQGYRHHSCCLDLYDSARNGCASCKLIWDSQWVEVGGILSDKELDLGPLEAQIIARTINEGPGNYTKIRYGQESRRQDHQNTLMTHYVPTSTGNITPDAPYLWSFLSTVASSDDRSSEYLQLRLLAAPAGRLDTWHHLVARWLQNCLESHEACSFQTSSQIQPPTRVVDVGPLDDTQNPFLFISDSRVQKWVTLSHCWGQKQPLRTTRETLHAHQQALPLDMLPSLFKDAVLITRKMGYRYLWIDSLCIIQDSEADWAQEIEQMGNIYKNCVFTISADNCRDSSDRILGNHVSPDQAREYVPQGCRSAIEGYHRLMYTFNRDKWLECHKIASEGDTTGFLASRAWALQEQILSPRTIHWTSLQIVWSCRCMTHSEEYPAGVGDLDRLQSLSDSLLYHSPKIVCLSQDRLKAAIDEQIVHRPDVAGYCSLLQLWYHIIQQFLTRRITFEADSLPAISGLAREIGRHTGYGYRAGIWAQDVHNGLLWSVAGPALYPSAYVAPSWSWASIKKTGQLLRSACIGPTSPLIANYQEKRIAFVPVAEIRHMGTVCTGDDEFGSVTSGSLYLTAPFRTIRALERGQIRLPLAMDKSYPLRDDPAAYKIKSGTAMCWLDARPEEEIDENNMAQVVQELRESGAALVMIAWLDCSDLEVAEDTTGANYYLGRYRRMLRDQHWALILVPVGGKERIWRRAGIARVADGLDEGWEKKELIII